MSAVLSDQWQPYRDQLAGYRYSLDPHGRFTRDGKPTGVFLMRYNGGKRIKAMMESGILWSGTSAEYFVKAFWHAEKVAPTIDPPGYAARVAELEAAGYTTGDAQSVADAEWLAVLNDTE